jgi:hypothetical protein
MPLEPTKELAAAIERLYEVFQHYPLPPNTNPCPCCHSPGDERPLYSRDLRKLTPDNLAQYANDALLVWGGVNDFRHFLPRIFEIVMSAEAFTFVDPEIIFAKLCHGEWRTWPQKEQEAIQVFLLAVWRAALEQPPSDDLTCSPEIETWLCCLAQATELSMYLDEWLNSFSSAATWNMAALIYRTGMPRTRPDGISPFWEGHMDQAQQLSEWLHTQPVREYLHRAATKYLDQRFAEELLAAEGVVN